MRGVRGVTLACLVSLTAAVVAPSASAALYASASHPSQVQVDEVYTVTVTVSNPGEPTHPVASGVRLTMTDDPDETLLGMSASQGSCASTASYKIDCQLGDIVPGQTVTMSYTGSAAAAGSVFHTVSARTATMQWDFGISIDVLSGPPPPPPPNADVTVEVTPAERVSGLRSIFSVTTRNLGSEPAPSVQLETRLAWSETVLSLAASQGTCALAEWRVVCDLGALAPGATATLTLRTRLPFNPSGDGHLALVSAPGTSSPDRSAHAPSVFSGRYWICHICGSALLPNGYELPGPAGAVTHPDDTVVLRDGSVIRIDGTLLLPTGEVVLPDGTILPPAPSGGGGAVPSPASSEPATPVTVTPVIATPAAPKLLARPTVTGIARVGGRLLGRPGRWSAGTRVASVRWVGCRAGRCIVVGRRGALALRKAHSGMRLRFEVRVTKAGRTAKSVSAWTGPVRSGSR